MAQQTAIEWLIQQEKLNDYFSNETINTAKEMEKEQSMNDFMAGKWDWAEHINGKESKDPAEYYNETYKEVLIRDLLDDAIHKHHLVHYPPPEIILMHPYTYWKLIVEIKSEPFYIRQPNKYNGIRIVCSFDITEEEIKVY